MKSSDQKVIRAAAQKLCDQQHPILADEIQRPCPDCRSAARIVVDAVVVQIRESWPYCGVCGEGEEAIRCEGCGEHGCEFCVGPRSGLCRACKAVGIE